MTELIKGQLSDRTKRTSFQLIALQQFVKGDFNFVLLQALQSFEHLTTSVTLHKPGN